MPGKTATLPDVDKTLKNARVELKTSPDAKNKLREAAQAVGVDLSAFILSAAMERAESVLDNQRRRELSNQSWELMNQLICSTDARPQGVNEKEKQRWSTSMKRLLCP